MGHAFFRDKVVLVTGASSGIGLASAQLLASEGALVVLMARGADELATARTEMESRFQGVKLATFVGDACQETDVKAALAFAHGLAGRLDILVPAVGGGQFRPLLMEDLESLRWQFDLSFTSAFLMIRYGVPLLERGGSIVCLSSAVVSQAYWGLSLYASAKAALERLVRAAAFELGGAGIRINAIRPGMTASQATAGMQEMAGLVEHFASETPLGRIGCPDDLAKAVRFLAGPESGWVTGQTFSCDGGQDQGQAPDMMDDLFGVDVMNCVRSGKEILPTG